MSLLRNTFRALNRSTESLVRPRTWRLFPLRMGIVVALFAVISPLGAPTIRTGPLWAASPGGDQHASVGQPKNAAPAKDLLVPFRAGETLNYRVIWAAFATAASLQVSVPERRNLFGWATWHFRAALHTQTPVRTLFTIDDEFDSYADAATLETRQYESYLDELGRKSNQVLHFVPVGQASRAPGPDVRVLPGTRDPVGVLYALRGVDWQRTAEFHVPLYDGRDIYQISARLEAGSDMVTVAAGKFSASRIAVRLSRNDKRAPDINFDLWLANDPARTPVAFQSVLPFGSVRAELAALPK